MKKILFVIALFFICPFFVSAKESVRTINYDYSYNQLSNYYDLSNPVFDTTQDALDSIKDYASSKNKKFVMTHYLSSTGNFVNSTLYFFDDSSNVTLKSDNSSFYLESTNHIVCTIQNFTTIDSFNSQISSCDDRLADSSNNVNSDIELLKTTLISDDNIVPSYNKVPYFSNISDLDYEVGNLHLGISSEFGSFNPFSEKNIQYLMYYNYLTKNISLFLPSVKFDISSFNVDSNNIIENVTVAAEFNFFDSKRYKVYVKEPDDVSFTQYFPINKNLNFFLTVNGSILIKIVYLSDENVFKNYSYAVDCIGQSSSVLDGVVSDNIYDDAVNGNNTGDDIFSSIRNFFEYYKGILFDSFPVIEQLKDLVEKFNYKNDDYIICPSDDSTGFEHYDAVISGYVPIEDKYYDLYHPKYCIPNVTLDFSFIGINKKFASVDLSIYGKYREFIFQLIKISVGVLTFFKVLNILERLFKK